MVLRYKPKFTRDIGKIRDKEVTKALALTMYNIRNSRIVSDIYNIKKLDEYSVHYRIKIKLDKEKDYRVGIIIRKNTVWLMRFLHRDKIYKEFP